MTTTELQLRDNIASVLSTVNKQNAPNVYKFIQTENGYKRIESMIIKMMIDDNITASATINNIEEML
jgi:hypothetical protein